MGIRPKLFLIFLSLGFAPMLLLSLLLYWNGVRSVESLLRDDAERDATGIKSEIKKALWEQEAVLISLARSPSLRDYVPGAPAKGSNRPTATGTGAGKTSTVPREVEAELRTFLLSNQVHCVSIVVLGSTQRPLLRAELVAGAAAVNGPEVRFQTDEFLSSSVMPDARVWTATDQTPLRAIESSNSAGTIVRYTIPVFASDASTSSAPRGALIVALNGDEMFKEAAAGRADLSGEAARFIVMLDRSGNILYHTNEALRHQHASQALRSFDSIAGVMTAGEKGWKYYDTDRTRWLVVYYPLEQLELSVAVAGNRNLAVHDVQRLGWVGLVLSAVFGLATALILLRVMGRMARSIEHVTEGAVAIAGGKLDQRIEVRSSDETRLLAESFNAMTDRLREQIARETESRQFETFMRLSAMLSHDLKNAIASLSMLVHNMERQFHREEFRKDAMQSVMEATDKLRALVAKLSEPMQTLSKEYQLPRPTDLMPIVRRVLDRTAAPAGSLHRIEMDLPASLVATVDAESIEKVFENLVINAIEAMGTQSGTLSIEAGPTAHDEVYLNFKDTGPGMSEEFQRTKLFRAFATTKKKGIGLGLYTCREVVKAYGGHIDVESKRGAGATFRVVLPSGQKIAQ